MTPLPAQTLSPTAARGLDSLDSQQISRPLRFDRAELAGALADLGVLVPIAVALIVKNGLSATAVLLPAGLLYVTAGLLYRLPVPVQPLKAFGAIAIAQGLGSNEIAAGALLMGMVFILLGASGWLDRVASIRSETSSFSCPSRGMGQPANGPVVDMQPKRWQRRPAGNGYSPMVAKRRIVGVPAAPQLAYRISRFLWLD